MIEVTWLLFIVASLALIATPGQDMLLVMSRSIVQGSAAGVATAGGVSPGCGPAVALAACPAGGKEAAHQIVNTGPVELKYLAVSTRLSPEIAEYPDSGKFGILAGYPAAPGERPRAFRFVGRESPCLDYWDGE